MLEPIFTTQFKKDLKLMAKRYKDIDALLEVMTLIIWDEPLPEKYREHNLSGTYAGFTECHVEGNLLLIYRFGDGTVAFFRTGSHSDVF